ncbi:MAG: 16S rRNA (guanine(527)-N(7))-methyltransferase RsmG [Georgenia sp.]
MGDADRALVPGVEEPSAAMRSFFGPAWPAVEQFAQMLVAEGELRGLIGPRELPRLWSRHIVNSAAVSVFLPTDVAVADVGTGAGFPGIITAAMRPELNVHLIEPMERRVAWLVEVVGEVGLDNVEIHHARAEDLHGKVAFGAVTARAVAAMDKLARWTLPLVAPGGSLVALKGERAGLEAERAREVLKKLGVVRTQVHHVTPLAGVEPTTVVVATKRG